MKLFKTNLLGCVLLAMVLSFFSCKSDIYNAETKKSNLEIKRFEKDLFSVDLYHVKDSIHRLQLKYPHFFPLFTNQIISIGDPSEPGFNDRLLSFVTDFTIYNVNKSVNEVFQSLEPFQTEISSSFNKYLKLFPNRQIPELITCISGFNQSIIIDDSLLVICLDKYLGSNSDFYKLLYPPVPEYARYVMHPAKISSDVMIAFIVTEFPYNDTKDNLLSRIIFEGRAMYVAKNLLPEVTDTLFWGYTPKQLKFCENNEKQMWTFLIENKYLFNSDRLIIVKFTEQAPFTKDFSKESPGRAAVWLGYQIVESYMKNNKDVSYQQLMAETDYLKILNVSKYNP